MSIQSVQNKTKDKIIRVAMDIIASEGFRGITVRKIAAEAEVNVAAVNYYFGSKENLISEALDYLTVQLKDTFEILKSDDTDTVARLSDFITSYMSVIAAYPDMIKSLITYAVEDKALQGHAEYSAFLQTEGVALISKAIKKVAPELDDLALSLKSLNLLSSLSMPYLMGNSIKKTLEVDLFNDEIRKVYAGILLDNITK
jgi:AcrR family transcriptional regulator